MSNYTPSPAYLIEIGFLYVRDPDLWVLQTNQTHSPLTGVPLTHTRQIEISREDHQIKCWDGVTHCSGSESIIRFQGRLRSEAEFDLLLWQIGWTDVEPS